MSKLDGKIAVVTGGNSGIGYASAKEFKEKGATVIITGRNEEKIKKEKEPLIQHNPKRRKKNVK